MKNPFHIHHAPIGSERPLEGVPVASGAGSESAPPSEVGEQTEMLTRLRRSHATAGSAASSGAPAEEEAPNGQGNSFGRILASGLLSW